MKTNLNGILGYKRAAWLRGLIMLLFVLMCMDAVIAYVRVTGFGMIEINPLCGIMGIFAFVLLKLIVAAASVPFWLWYGRRQYLVTVIVVSFLTGLYLCPIMMNMYNMMVIL